MKRVFLELGGKSADDRAGRRRLRDRRCRSGSMVCMHAGQGCAMQTRMLLPRSRYDEGVELITQAIEHGAVRRPYRPERDDGPADQRQAARSRARLHRQGSARKGPSSCVGGGRPAAVPEGLLGRADAVRRRGQLDDHRPGGDLRPRPGRDPVRGRRRRRAHRQRQRLRPVGRRALGVRRARPSPSRGASAPGSIGVNGGMWYGADSPYGGYKASGVGRQNGLEGFEQYLETKAIAWLRP